MNRRITTEHIVGFAIGCIFIFVGAACLGYAARGLSYAIAGIAGVGLASGGLKAIRTILRDMDERGMA